MKKISILSALVLVFQLTSFSQQEENGTIYIKHPYIDAVNKATQAYNDKDWTSGKTFFADSARWWASGMEKPVPIADAFKIWAADYDSFDSVQLVKAKGSYPDYLHYKDQDGKTVQSWWVWSGKSKKSGEMIKVYFVLFADFNSAGKIAYEGMFGDFSKLTAAK